MYEIYYKKILETLLGVEQTSNLTDLSFPQNSVIRFNKSKNFKGFFVDFEYVSLNGKLKSISSEKCFPLNKFNSLKLLLSDRDKAKCDKIILMLSQLNSEHLQVNKMEKIKRSLLNFQTNKNNVPFLIIYLFLYLCQKEREFSFNAPMVEMLEELIFDYIPNLFLPNKTDYETLFFITYICYEMNFYKVVVQSELFSFRIVKFLRSLAIWHKPQLWCEFVNMAKNVAKNPIITMFFSSLKKYPKEKVPIVYIRDIYQFLIYVGFHLLKIPFNVFFDMINEANEISKDLRINVIMEMSKELECHIERNYSKKNVSIRNVQILGDRNKMVKKCLKQALLFLEPLKDNIIKLLFLNKNFYKTFRKTVLKRFVQSNLKNKHIQIKMWLLIVDCDLSFMEIFKRISENFDSGTTILNKNGPIANQIKLDVNRTNFVPLNLRSILENILVSTSQEFTLLSYYQGMNYICGFILSFTQDKEQTLKIFNYLICKKMDIYFRNNFANLRKMLFISEHLVRKYNPTFDEHLSRCSVTTDYYLSSFLLTLFTNSLPQIDNFAIIARVFDILISMGWLGVYKFVVEIK